MATHIILTYPDERLKLISPLVEVFDDALRRFVMDLFVTLYASPGAVGIAAPQVGAQQRLILIDVSKKKGVENHGKLVLINPEITQWEGFILGREGCLSIPDYTANVLRAEKIQLEAYDEHGVKTIYAMQGFEARAVQHEIDHLDGVLFLDRLISPRTDLFRRKNYAK